MDIGVMHDEESLKYLAERKAYKKKVENEEDFEVRFHITHCTFKNEKLHCTNYRSFVKELLEQLETALPMRCYCGYSHGYKDISLRGVICTKQVFEFWLKESEKQVYIDIFTKLVEKYQEEYYYEVQDLMEAIRNREE